MFTAAAIFLNGAAWGAIVAMAVVSSRLEALLGLPMVALGSLLTLQAWVNRERSY